MPIQPQAVWASLPGELRHQVAEEITTVFQEVIREHIRVDHVEAS